jgi:uncharacterized delta-60 repeat protein
MPLPVSGAISAADINVELTRVSTATFVINGADERGLAGVPTGVIAFNDFYGKTFVPPPGSLDSTFNVGTGFNSSVNSTAIQSDGKVIIGGNFTSYSGTTTNYIARLHSNGVLDTGFNVGTGGNNSVESISIQPDGRVVIGGFFTLYNGSFRNRIARLHSNGSVDAAFFPRTGANQFVNTTALLSDNRIIIGGLFTSYSGTTTNYIARIHPNGVLDTSFNVGAGANWIVYTSAMQSNNRVTIGGAFTAYRGTSRNRISRIHINGAIDSDLAIGFGVNAPLTAFVHTISIQSDGKVIIGGEFTSYRKGTITSARNNIARLHSNGNMDTDFDVGTGFNSSVRTTAVHSDGKVIIGGLFTAYSGTTINRIARLHTNGVLDTGFNVGAGANGEVITISIQSDGKIIIGGGFSSYRGIPMSGIARINPV